MDYKKNVICIEGSWTRDVTKHNSVLHGLDLLDKNRILKYSHKPSHFKENTLTLLEKFTQKTYKNYSIIYLSFHGEPGMIGWGKETLSLDEIETRLAGRLTGKILHFGSCQTVNLNKRRLTKFLVNTGATAISGFATDVGFIESTLFDFLYFETCQHQNNMADVESEMKIKYGQFGRRLGFRIVVHP